MDISALLAQLQAQLPDFWSQKLEEQNGMSTLLTAYSYVYGSAFQKWQTLENELSPFTTDAWLTDFYKVIDLHKTIIPSDPSFNGNGNFYYLLPKGTFNIDSLSRDLTFTNNLNYNIVNDIPLQQTLLEIPASQLTSQDHYLYIQEYDIDNDNMLKTWGALFPGILPYVNPHIHIYDSTTFYSQYINSANYKIYLLNIKAQIMAFIRCATLGGTLDSIESLFSIAMNQPYVTQDGIIVNFDNANTWIESNGVITQYTIPPKQKFKQPNQPISAYEAIGECPALFYTWQSNPARFTQQLLCSDGNNLFSLLTLLNNESPNALYFDMPHLVWDESSDTLTFDFGVMSKPSNAFNVSMDYITPAQGLLNDFTAWTNPTLNPTIYEMLKNVIIAEIPDDSHVIGVSITWASTVLEYFRALHSKYLTISISLGG